MAKLYAVDGSITEVTPKNGKDFKLEEMQEFVGGYIQVVPLAKGRCIVVDEEGRLKGYQHNAKASQVTYGLVIGDIVGNMLLLERGEIK
jgi:hypothetical protein